MLLVTLLTCVVIGFTLASYLVLVSSQNRSVMRSLAWNSAIPVLEAGVEEALTQLRHREVSELHSNGWTPVNGRYAKELRIDDSYCHVAIEVSGPTPVICSTAYVLGDGEYQLSRLGGTVLIRGDAVLHVTDSIGFSGNDSLQIAPGDSLKVYMSGASASFAGNATWNENGSPLRLQYFGLPGNSSIAISGNGAFSLAPSTPPRLTSP